MCSTRRNMLLAEDEVNDGAVIITIKAAGAGVLKLLHYFLCTALLLHYHYHLVHLPHIHSPHAVSTWQLRDSILGTCEGQVHI